MTIPKDVLVELLRMFVADARLTAAILATVAITAVLIDATRLLCGPLLHLFSC